MYQNFTGLKSINIKVIWLFSFGVFQSNWGTMIVESEIGWTDRYIVSPPQLVICIKYSRKVLYNIKKIMGCIY